MIQSQQLSEPAAEPLLQPVGAFADHLQDASHFRGQAEQIAFPETEEQVAYLLRQAYRQKKWVTLSGAGTGLTGGRVPQGGWVLCLEKMNRILNQSEQTVTVQPGVSLQMLEEALDPQNRFYPPDPGEKNASLGGTVATNASGSRSLKYGPTRRFVRRLRVILPQGELLEIRRGQEKAQGNLLSFRRAQGGVVEIPLPTIPRPQTKNAAGYFFEPAMDWIDLFIGAEGTLGVVTEMELEILQKPEAILSGILFFDTEWDCFAFSEQARQMQARSLEFFDSRSLAFLSQKHPDIPQGAGGAIYFQRECVASEYGPLLAEWTRRAEELKARPSDSWFAQDEQELQLFRRLRYDLPIGVNEQAALNGFRKVGTDFSVPATEGEAMFNYYLTELPKHPVEFLIWGHLGEHHLHVNFLPKSAQEFERALSLYAQMAKKAVQFGGTVSAEHGIGKLRIPYLEMMIGKEGLRQMARVKKCLDPEGLLNRGNIIPAELLEETP